MAGLAALAATLAAAVGPGAASAAPKPPNVVVIMTDDQDFRSLGVLPQTRRLITNRGTTFANHIASYPLCCPSRATFLTGQYAHNHGVLWNNAPQGGYYKLDGSETLPVWLRRAGYRTIHIGKYLNEYGERDPLEIPPGWSDWHGGVDPSTYDYYGYTLNHNGRLQTYGFGPDDYSTDVYADLAEQAIVDAKRAGEPFFLNLAPLAPHTQAGAARGRLEGTPAVPAPRHSDVFADAELPRYPNFDEADLSDKPPLLQQIFPPLSADQIAALTDHYRGRIGSLLAVDDMVAQVSQALKRTGQWGHTVIVFTSDNGWILGEHRLRDPVTFDGRAAGVKYLPYEGSTHVPLMVAGPGFRHGTVEGVTVNADLAPTILDVTGAVPTLPQDGTSLVNVARDPGLLEDRAVLYETGPNARAPVIWGVRTERYRYDLLSTGDEGLYDLARDPWELQSVHDDPRYAQIKAILAGVLDDLRACLGPSCAVPVQLPEPTGPPLVPR